MRTPRRDRGAAVRLAAVAGLTALVAAACAPAAPGPAPTPGPPVIEVFAAPVARSAAPVVATVSWRVTDPDGSPVTCSLDLDGDGSDDQTVVPCTSGTRLVQFDGPGDRTLRLSATDGSGPAATATVAVSVGPAPTESYSVDLRVDPTLSPELAAAFEQAADRWEAVLGVGVPDVPLQLPDGFLGWVPAFDGVVDDVLIDVHAPFIDGPRGTLGRAGALLTREGGRQAYYGFMELDVADLERQLAEGRLVNLITHEIGHVLGIGATWVLQGLVTDVLTDPVYVGAAGGAAYAELGRSGPVPVENEGGLGSLFGHWRESVFGNELMTAFADRGAEPLSRLSVAALADLGYGVDLAGAEPYTPPFLGGALRAAATEEHSHSGDADADGADADEGRLHTEPVAPIGTRLPG